MRFRRSGRVDANHAAIVRRFREWGWSVQSLAAIGDGCPDLVVAFKGRLELVEIKREKAKPNPLQVAWHDAWESEVLIVRTIDDVDNLALGKQEHRL